MSEQLSFREYMLKRSRRYTPASAFVQFVLKDERFLAINPREDLDAYLRQHNVVPNERIYVAVWSSYLNARKRHNRRIALERTALPSIRDTEANDCKTER
jgi:hypothetical protein